MLEEIADAIEGKPIKVKLTPDVVSLAFLERVPQACFAPESTAILRIPHRLIRYLYREIDLLTASLPKRSRRDFRPGRTDR
jgi:hypothetical protein